MSSILSNSTSSSLLSGVRRRDADAWRRLARLYTPLVYRWARQCGLQASDAADIAQEVFLAVATHVDDFSNEATTSSFRGWLWTITRNQIRLFYRQRKGRPQATGGTDARRALDSHPDLLEQDDEPAGAGEPQGLIRRALELIRQDFQEQTWQAFLRLAIDGQSAAEIASDLNMTPAAVRQAKYRVLCRLHDELAHC
jgi:RNA polymerase sigma-70 factor (ECF subfamily)